MNVSVFDFHCDTALALLGRDMNSQGDLRKNSHHIDLERASALSGYAQCFACFTTPFMEKWAKVPVTTVFERELAAIQREVERNSDIISIARSADEVQNNRANGKMSAILTLEGTAGINYDPAAMEKVYDIGFRVASLGWNEQNALTGSNVTGGGLTDQGREFVKEAQRLGILIDVSHISDEAFWDIIHMTQAPIIATHSNSRTICGHSRNLTDDMFKVIVETGGVAGYNMCADFTFEKDPTLDHVCDHILHFLELDPTGKHIALGGDLDGVETMPAGFLGVQDFPKLADRLLARGLNEGMIHDIFWNNAIGVMERAVCNHKR